MGGSGDGSPKRAGSYPPLFRLGTAVVSGIPQNLARGPSRQSPQMTVNTKPRTATLGQQMTEAEKAFATEYAPYFGRERMRALAASGKFICETGASGAYIRDLAGRQYLDCFLATGVFSLGHSNVNVRRALQQAITSESYSGVFYLSEAKAKLARKLAETMPAGLSVALPAVGGGEAIDLAIKLAAGVTGRKGVICCSNSYHGSAGLTAELGPPALKDWYPLRALDVTRVQTGDIEALREVLDDSVAAVVMEPIRSLYDGRKADAAYWAEVRALCDANGAKLIVDEVVCGMGRLGTLWGSSQFDIRADALVTAKGLSGGFFPMSALIVREELIAQWGDNPFRAYSSYAWSNVGARVAMAALDETERLLPLVAPVADALEVGLQALAADFPDTIAGIHRTGLHFVLEPRPGTVTGRDLTLQCLAGGLLLQASGAYPEAPPKLLPPLCLEPAHIDEICTKLSDALCALGA